MFSTADKVEEARHRHEMPFGATLLDGDTGVLFRLYAPDRSAVSLVLSSPRGDTTVSMVGRGDGWFEYTSRASGAGTRYRFAIGDRLVPDPAGRFAPDGVNGASEVIDPLAYAWTATNWTGRPWHEYVFYEIHVGTFTPSGTYAEAMTKLDDLCALGITAIQVMPLAEAPGSRNWGYDGVLPFAPSHNYGKPDELKAFVDAAHALGIAVFLDVVYNHFGPEANYLSSYAERFYTDKFHTPWGAAIDVIDEDRADVRRFFFENSLYWLEEFRFDGLRFDAVHEIYDGPDRRFMHELARTVRERVDRHVHLIVENERNEAGLLENGYRAQWADDLHNSLHVAITGQTEGYYADFEDGNLDKVARALCEGFVYQGEVRPTKADETRGEPSAHLELASFVTFLQNHDQVGNRPFGDRITRETDPAAVRAAAATILLAPQIPMIFMGEEWAASTPFLFFCDFEPELAQKVTEGRRREFKDFPEFADSEARERIPDPSAPDTFQKSKLAWNERACEPHASWLSFYRTLLTIRREEIATRTVGVRGTDASAQRIGDRGLVVRWTMRDGSTLRLDANYGAAPQPGFEPTAPGRILYSSHGDHSNQNGIAQPWSVRWTVEDRTVRG